MTFIFLHNDPEIVPDPYTLMPERWLDLNEG